MGMALLSIVLPSYNEEQNIANTANVLAELLEKEQIDYEKLLKDASTIKKEIDVVINGLFYKNQIDIEYNPIKDKIDEDFVYDMKKTIDEQLEQYKSSFELEQKIETDEMLNNYVCQIKQQETLKDLIDKINQD